MFICINKIFMDNMNTNSHYYLSLHAHHSFSKIDLLLTMSPTVVMLWTFYSIFVCYVAYCMYILWQTRQQTYMQKRRPALILFIVLIGFAKSSSGSYILFFLHSFQHILIFHVISNSQCHLGRRHITSLPFSCQLF